MSDMRARGGCLHLLHGKNLLDGLVKNDSRSVSEVDEKRMNTSIRHVSQDNCLMLSKRQVNSERS